MHICMYIYVCTCIKMQWVKAWAPGFRVQGSAQQASHCDAKG